MQATLNAFQFTLSYAELLIADIEDPELTLVPHPGMNHPAWILGHLSIAADLVPKLLGEEFQTDADWMKTFGPGSIPVADRAAYPSKEALLQTLKELYARAETLASAATAEQLAAPNPTPFFPQQFPTVGDLLTHLLTTHAAMHLGQLSAWRRCLGYGSVLQLPGE